MERLTDAERRFGWFMLICGVVYLLGGIGFWLLPAFNQAIAEVITGFAGLGTSGALPAPMWLPLGISMMWTIAACALIAGVDPRRNRVFAIPVIVSKGVSTAAAAWFVIRGVGQASALAVVITDLPLLIATLWLYRAAMCSVGGRWLVAGPPIG